MGLRAKKTPGSELLHGDHIAVDRRNAYTHHGIYVEESEEGQLVHRVYHQVNGKRGRAMRYNCPHIRGLDTPKKHDMKRTCLPCFLQGGSVRRFTYGTSALKMTLKSGGSCSTRECDNADVVADRVVKLYNSESGFGKYNAVSNNCEKLAYYCKTGVHMERSNQVMRGVTVLGVGGAGFLPRYCMYLLYGELLGVGAVVPIALHSLAHRLRAVRVDKRLNLTSRSKKISVDDLIILLETEAKIRPETEANVIGCKEILYVIH